LTAAYKLTAALADGSLLKAVWNSKHHELVRLYRVRGGQIEDKQSFPDQYAADARAHQLGVARWRLASAIRITPFAATLGIIFPDAPEPAVLLAALDRLKSGTPLLRLAAELQTDPIVARAWLSGQDPGCAEALGWELPNLKSADVWGGDPYA